MAQKYTMLSDEAVSKLCSLVRESHSVADAISDDTVATNSTYSSFKINELLSDTVVNEVNQKVTELVDDTTVDAQKLWSSEKINIELEDVRGELDVIVSEANKNTTISDDVTSLTTTWSSQKTSDEIAKKQENIFKKRIFQRKGDTSDTKQYCLIATVNVNNTSNINEPIVIEGVMGGASGAIQKMLFEACFDFRSGVSEDAKVIHGYVNRSLFNYIDFLVTLDESAKIAYLYVHHKTNYSLIDADISIPQKNADLYLTVPETFERIETFLGTEMLRMSTSADVKVLAGLDDTTSSTTSTYSSAKIDELNANRQVKTFDNTSSSTEKWYKICSALTVGIGCNIKLTASRADSTATVQYFSALFRDNRYRYTSTSLTRERTVYESELVAEYSSYIVADANNDIWVHAPSYGKVIIEIDTRAITIDGTVGTPVKDYVYSSYESQSIKERLDRMNIKQFNQPGSNTSFKYVTITSTGIGVGGLELNIPYAGKYMFSTPKSEPVYFGSSTHKGYTLNGWAWSDDGKTLHLRVTGFAPFSISVLGSVPNDISVNNVVTISDMTSAVPEGVTFVSSPVYSNATTNDIGVKQVFYASSTSYPSIFWVLSDATTGVFWFKHTLSDSAGVKSVEGYADLTHNVARLISGSESDIAVLVGTDTTSGKKGVRFTATWGDSSTTSCKITEARPVTAIPTQITTR